MIPHCMTAFGFLNRKYPTSSLKENLKITTFSVLKDIVHDFLFVSEKLISSFQTDGESDVIIMAEEEINKNMS